MNRIVKSIAVLAVALLAAVPALARQWRDEPAVQKLYADAKKDGEVMVWGTAHDEVAWIPAAFGTMFPGIDVKFLGDNDISVKAIAEYRAGTYDVDVFLTSYSSGRAVLERKMYATNDWSIFGISKDYVVFDGQAALTHNLIYSVVYNKNLVKKEDLPKQWTDLLDPRYKDKMVASSFLLPRVIGALGLMWGEDKATQFARDIIAKTGILVSRAPPQNLLQSGERLYAVANFESQARMWASQGLPTDSVIPAPVVGGQFYSAVMAKAPHPAAAKLLAGWMATPDGKHAAEAANFEADYRKGSDNPVAQAIYASNEPIIFETLENMDKRDALIAKINPIVAGQVK